MVLPRPGLAKPSDHANAAPHQRKSKTTQTRKDIFLPLCHQPERKTSCWHIRGAAAAFEPSKAAGAFAVTWGFVPFSFSEADIDGTGGSCSGLTFHEDCTPSGKRRPVGPRSRSARSPVGWCRLLPCRLTPRGSGRGWER